MGNVWKRKLFKAGFLEREDVGGQRQIGSTTSRHGLDLAGDNWSTRHSTQKHGESWFIVRPTLGSTTVKEEEELLWLGGLWTQLLTICLAHRHKFNGEKACRFTTHFVILCSLSDANVIENVTTNFMINR